MKKKIITILKIRHKHIYAPTGKFIWCCFDNNSTLSYVDFYQPNDFNGRRKKVYECYCGFATTELTPTPLSVCVNGEERVAKL